MPTRISYATSGKSQKSRFLSFRCVAKLFSRRTKKLLLILELKTRKKVRIAIFDNPSYDFRSSLGNFTAERLLFSSKRDSTAWAHTISIQLYFDFELCRSGTASNDWVTSTFWRKNFVPSVAWSYLKLAQQFLINYQQTREFVSEAKTFR